MEIKAEDNRKLLEKEYKKNNSQHLQKVWSISLSNIQSLDN